MILRWDRVAPLAVAAALVCTHGAGAFDIEGYRSGMTASELAVAVERWGLALTCSNNDKCAAWSAGRDQQVDITGQFIDFTFCHSSLVSFGHNIDFELDYIATLEAFLTQYGTPARVKVRTQPWSGPGGGYVKTVDTFWYSGDDRIQLSFNPEARTSSGMLRYSRGASVAYSAQNNCWPARNW
jgi:hypothetical protein